MQLTDWRSTDLTHVVPPTHRLTDYSGTRGNKVGKGKVP